MDSAMKKDKQQVVGEELDEIKVRRFLDMQPQQDENADFHILTKAYRGLPPEPFARFMDMYLAEGYTLNPSNKQGVTFLDSIRAHKSQQAYVDILESLSAKII
jgi:hypothetical protein